MHTGGMDGVIIRQPHAEYKRGLRKSVGMWRKADGLEEDQGCL